MHMDYVIFLILSNIAYTKFSEGPDGFSLISALVNLLPDAVDFLSQVAGAFGGSFCITFIYHLATAADTMLRIVKKLLFICLGFKALNQGTIAVPAVDKLIGRFMR